ncbi:bifunctional DNA primase/polymerase, partial [Nostoc sp. HG1]|nr:bifunctional DNA primase/polymerase [Nostoc sp. HG1]
MTLLREAALRYANDGWAVFPLVPRKKMPLIPKDEADAKAKGWPGAGRGCRDATSNLIQVDRWWSKCPNANIGIATGPASGVFVVDLDNEVARATYLARVIFARHEPADAKRLAPL